MADLASPQYIQGAPRVPLPFGLFSVVTPADTARIEMGAEWEPLTCEPATGFPYDCDTLVSKTFASGGGVADANPFTVMGSYRCAPLANSVENAKSKALEHLQVREEAVVEKALWTGDLGNTPNLVTGAVTLGTALDPEVGIALLEQFIATSYGSLGLIHMTRAAAVIAIAAKALEVKGGSLQTRLGTPVVAGAGYPGTAPNGAAPATGTSWVFASPAVFGYRRATPVTNAQVDRGVNLMTALAERNYLLGFDPCGTAAVNINLNA